MEDVLEVYQRPYDGNEVLVCMDETSKQQVKETESLQAWTPTGSVVTSEKDWER